MSLAVQDIQEGLVDLSLEDDCEYAEEIGAELAKLTKMQLYAFRAYLDNFLSGNRMTNKALCAKIGVSHEWLSRIKLLPAWSRAYQLIITNFAVNRTLDKTDEYIDNLENLAKEETNANRTLLQISNILKHSGSVNINLNQKDYSIANNANPTETLDSMLIQLGRLGITPDVITNRFIELKNQNAF